MTNTIIDELIHLLSKVPGLGPRSGRRAALELLKKKESLMLPLGHQLIEASQKVIKCQYCGNLDLQDPCHICSDPTRDHKKICVVEDIADLWAIERTKTFKGRYHVLGGSLSALDGVGPDQLRIPYLIDYVRNNDCEEVIIATNATIEGQTTAHYIQDCLKTLTVKVSRLAHGVPMGGELDYLDDGTLSLALNSRNTVG